MTRILVRFHDADDSRYDRFALSPEGMTRQEANRKGSAIAVKVKEADPDEYNADDLYSALEADGWICPQTISADEPF